jgi:hypothetical protein
MSTDQYFVIVADPAYCLQCGTPQPTPEARVISAKVVADSWVTTGRLEFHQKCSSPTCAMAVQVIERAVPIQCEGFTCPACHKAEHLSYEVTKVDNEALQFTATITCTVCKKKRTLSKTLKKLLSVLTIKVGPFGISAKKSEEKEEGED